MWGHYCCLRLPSIHTYESKNKVRTGCLVICMFLCSGSVNHKRDTPVNNHHAIQHLSHINFSCTPHRLKTADSESRHTPVETKGPTTTLHKHTDRHPKDKTSGCNAFSILSKLDAHLINLRLCFCPHSLNVVFLLIIDPDEQLLSIMESICGLVDSIPEHELIALSCGDQLLLKRAQRKRILANGGDISLRMQQPDSTVILEPGCKRKRSSIADAPSVMSSTSRLPVDAKKPIQIRRSSVISVSCDSDESDGIISNVKPAHSEDNRIICVENQSMRDSPSTIYHTNSFHNFSQKTSIDLDGSDLFFSPEKPQTAVQSSGSVNAKTPAGIKATENMAQDDFYMDDFDIDDWDESDIYGYFDDHQSPSVSGQNSSTATTAVKVGGASKSLWEKKPATPVPAPKPTKICSPGKPA